MARKKKQAVRRPSQPKDRRPEVMNIHRAKTHFSELIQKVVGGEEIVIFRDGHPVAKLVPLEAAPEPRVLGLDRDRIKISSDFESPIPELEEFFSGIARESKTEEG